MKKLKDIPVKGEVKLKSGNSVGFHRAEYRGKDYVFLDLIRELPSGTYRYQIPRENVDFIMFYAKPRK